MVKENMEFLSKPLISMTGEDFSSLLKHTLEDLHKSRELAHGLKELQEKLGCSLLTTRKLSRLGVFDDATVSSVGKRKLYDVDKARELAARYQKETNCK